MLLLTATLGRKRCDKLNLSELGLSVTMKQETQRIIIRRTQHIVTQCM